MYLLQTVHTEQHIYSSTYGFIYMGRNPGGINWRGHHVGDPWPSVIIICSVGKRRASAAAEFEVSTSQLTQLTATRQ